MLVHRYAVIKEPPRYAPALGRDAALPGSRTEDELASDRPIMEIGSQTQTAPVLQLGISI